MKHTPGNHLPHLLSIDQKRQVIDHVKLLTSNGNHLEAYRTYIKYFPGR